MNEEFIAALSLITRILLSITFLYNFYYYFMLPLTKLMADILNVLQLISLKLDGINKQLENRNLVKTIEEITKIDN